MFTKAAFIFPPPARLTPKLSNRSSVRLTRSKMSSSPPSATASAPPPASLPSKYFDSHTHIQSTLSRLRRPATPTTVSGFLASPPLPAPKPKSHPLAAPGAVAAAFGGCLNVNCDVPSRISVDLALKLAGGDGEEEPRLGFFNSFGVHPHNAKDFDMDPSGRHVGELRRALAHPRTVAVGECGLDYFQPWSTTPDNLACQREVFRFQLRLAVELDMPVVVHTRDADADTIADLEECLPQGWPVHLHCWTASGERLRPFLDKFEGLCVGFTGCITFKKAEDVRGAVAEVPLDRLLLETDAPYEISFTPHPR